MWNNLPSLGTLAEKAGKFIEEHAEAVSGVADVDPTGAVYMGGVKTVANEPPATKTPAKKVAQKKKKTPEKPPAESKKTEAADQAASSAPGGSSAPAAGGAAAEASSGAPPKEATAGEPAAAAAPAVGDDASAALDAAAANGSPAAAADSAPVPAAAPAAQAGPAVSAPGAADASFTVDDNDVASLQEQLQAAIELLGERDAQVDELQGVVDELHRKLQEKDQELDSYVSAAASLASTAGLAADRAQQAASAEADLSAAREELAQRLAAAERKVFALTKERDALKREVERRSDTAELLKQKDDIIVQVMAEGERLSKRCADLEGTIKKLKAERKEQEAEKERLSQRLAAEAERTEAAKRERAVMEEELRSALDERSAELEEARVFYEEELRRARERVTEAESRADDDGRERLEKIIKEAFEREQALAARVEETQAALARAAESAAFREDLLRKDAREWESRCLAAEQRHEELAARIPESTRPLLRQIEALQATAASRTEAFAAAERSLTARVAEAEEAAQQTAEAAAGAKGKAAALSARLSELQAAHQATQAELASAQKALQRERELVQDARVESRAAVEAAAAQAGRIAALEHESEARLARQRAQVAEEKGRLDAAQAMWQAERRAPLWREEFQKREQELMHKYREASAALAAASGSAAGGNALGGVAASASTDSLVSPSAAGAATPRHFRESTHKALSGGLGGVVALETLQAALRQRETELEFMESRCRKLEATRDSLANELLSTSSKVSNATALDIENRTLKSQLADLQDKFQAALELAGERDMQLEELVQDQQDLRELCKKQAEALAAVSAAGGNGAAANGVSLHTLVTPVKSSGSSAAGTPQRGVGAGTPAGTPV